MRNLGKGGNFRPRIVPIADCEKTITFSMLLILRPAPHDFQQIIIHVRKGSETKIEDSLNHLSALVAVLPRVQSDGRIFGGASNE
jgi:hypothetical protein